jgi:hypothetical protein
VWGYGVLVVVAVVDDHSAPGLHGVEEHVVACENSDDTVAVDTDVAFDDYCSCRILDADGVDRSLVDAADNLAPKKDRGAAVVVLSGHDQAAAAGDTIGVVAGIDVGDSLPQL